MKRYIILLLFIVLVFKSYAQEIRYGYDAAGNRISRYVVETKASEDIEEFADAEPQDFKLDENTDIRLYPNPTSGLLSFEVINPEMQDNPEIQIKVYSVSGSLIREEEYQSASFTIDISDEQNGTYLLDMKVNGKQQNFTIIKQ